MKILVVEDEKSLCDSIIDYLREEGHVCDGVGNFDKADLNIALTEYDCVIVDITLPDGSGLDIIRELKKNKSKSGIIIISAKNSLDDKISGLDIGADDYLTKPFHLAELNARIKSLMRRSRFEGSNEILFNEIRIVPESRQVFLRDREIDLTSKEFDLLVYFISNKNRVVTKESIVEHIWENYAEDADSFDFVYTHIKNLRKKIMQQGGSDYIQTVYGMGYKFTEK
jgi:DNA-binding response OmpR family regulator